MSGDVLVIKNTCSGGDIGDDVERLVRGGKPITDMSPNIRRCIREDYGINRRYIG